MIFGAIIALLPIFLVIVFPFFRRAWREIDDSIIGVSVIFAIAILTMCFGMCIANVLWNNYQEKLLFEAHDKFEKDYIYVKSQFKPHNGSYKFVYGKIPNDTNYNHNLDYFGFKYITNYPENKIQLPVELLETHLNIRNYFLESNTITDTLYICNDKLTEKNEAKSIKNCVSREYNKIVVNVFRNELMIDSTGKLVVNRITIK